MLPIHINHINILTLTNVTFSRKNRTKSRAPHIIKAAFIDLTIFVQCFPRSHTFTLVNLCSLFMDANITFLFTRVITWPSYARHVKISGPAGTSRFGKRNRYVQTLRQNVPLWWKQNTNFLYFAIAIFLKCRRYFTICLKGGSVLFLSVSTVGLLIVL